MRFQFWRRLKHISQRLTLSLRKRILRIRSARSSRLLDSPPPCRYDLDDTPSQSASGNAAAAFDFLRELEARKKAESDASLCEKTFPTVKQEAIYPFAPCTGEFLS